MSAETCWGQKYLFKTFMCINYECFVKNIYTEHHKNFKSGILESTFSVKTENNCITIVFINVKL